MQSLVKLFNKNAGAKAVVILLIITLIIIAFSTMSIGAPGITYGDVNNDGDINVRDVVLVMQNILGLRDLTENQFKAADVNRDSSVDVKDATMIMRHVLNIEPLPKGIISVEEVKITVFVNNPVDKLYLTSKVWTTLDDDSETDIYVNWEETSTPPYVAEVIGEYTFKGDLVNLPKGILNPDEIRASAVVEVIRRGITPRPHPDPDFDLYRLFLVPIPQPGGTYTGEGEYQEGESVPVEAIPNPGFEFVNWIDDIDDSVVSTEASFTYTMPARDTVLIANFESTWPEEMFGLPIITYVELGDFYAVTIIIKDEYVDRVQSVTIMGKTANQDPNNPARWRATFDDEVTLEDLRGEIDIDEPDEVNVVDLTKSTAFLIDILDNDIAVRVYLKANETATSVTADGTPLSFNAAEGRWQKTLFGYQVGDNVEVKVLTADGQQTVNLEVVD